MLTCINFFHLEFGCDADACMLKFCQRLLHIAVGVIIVGGRVLGFILYPWQKLSLLSPQIRYSVNEDGLVW